MAKLPPAERDKLQLGSLQAGKIASRRLFAGVRRGIKDGKAYDETGIFIQNKWGRNAIKIFVDHDNKPHLEIYDALGKSIVYDLKIPTS